MPNLPSSTGTGNVRTTHLLDGKDTVGSLTAHLTPHPYAILQLLDLHVAQHHRRKGVATRLLTAALADAQAQLGTHKLRRAYMNLPHKSAVDLRAFLTHAGFHHVTTTTGLVMGEDLLTYVKSYT
jgi:GNAT superfamily N-acetyltransferase